MYRRRASRALPRPLRYWVRYRTTLALTAWMSPAERGNEMRAGSCEAGFCVLFGFPRHCTVPRPGRPFTGEEGKKLRASGLCGLKTWPNWRPTNEMPPQPPAVGGWPVTADNRRVSGSAGRRYSLAKRRKETAGVLKGRPVPHRMAPDDSLPRRPAPWTTHSCIRGFAT